MRDAVSRFDFAKRRIQHLKNFQVIENEVVRRLAWASRMGHPLAQGTARVAFLHEPHH